MRVDLRKLLCVAVVVLAGLPASAVVTLPKIIGDHMVLQQGEEAPVWGKTSTGDKVTVSMCGKTVSTTACVKGYWQVELPKMKPGRPYEMTIRDKDSSVTVKDILVGEVWMGSGQSNMQWAVKDTNNAEAEIAAANYPEIRLFYVERKVAETPQWDCSGSWQVCTPENIPMFSAVLYYFGRDLHKELGVPMGLIHTSWGGTPAESWASAPALEANPEFKPLLDRWADIIANYPAAKAAYDEAVKKWEAEAAVAKSENKPEPNKPGAPQGPDSPGRPSSLYNAMIAPLVPYGVRGAIWYQGESNAPRAYQYRALFLAMINDWRRAWDDDFAFYFVQLANFTKRLDEPADSDWAELREAQTRTLSLPHTGQAVIIDIGEAENIHPRNKQEIGKRLALIALAKDYGRKVEYSGPMFKSAKFGRGKATISFKHATGLKTSDGGAPREFAVAGADKKFYWADAAIEGNKVVLRCKDVAEPVAVRYGWANNPDVNVYNGAGLPASPFRSDDWPGITFGKN